MTPAALLARRRRYLTAATARHAPRKIPRALQPTGPTLALTAATTAIARDLDEAFRDALADEGLAFPRSDAADGDPRGLPPIDRPRLFARLQRLAESIVRRRGTFLDDTLAKVGAQVASFSREQFQRQTKAAAGIELTTLEPNLAPAIDAFRDEHVALIRSMAGDKIARTRRILDDAGVGTRVETVMKQLVEETGVTKRQAALVARDQILKLNSAVTKKRHEAAGITEYIWRTSGDASVRPEHRALEGKRFKYDEPPVSEKDGSRGRPGEKWQCRCTMEPVVEGFDEEVAPEPTQPEHNREAFAQGPRERPGLRRRRTPAAPSSPAASSPPAADDDTGPVTVQAAQWGKAGPPREWDKSKRPAPRVEYDTPPPPPPRRYADVPKRNRVPLDNKPQDFSAMPIDRELQGIALGDHVAPVQYPANRVGDESFDRHVAAETVEALSEVSPADRLALERYTGPAYGRVNLTLRAGEEAAAKRYGKKGLADVEEIAVGTDRALARLPRAPADMTLFRGIKLNTPAELDAFANASTVESPTFMSTSRDPKVAVGFGGGENGDDPSVIYRIRKHRSGAILSDKISNAAESEVLFPRGARFKIVGRQRVSETRLVLDLEETE